MRAVERNRDHLFHTVFSPRVNQTLTGDVIRALVEETIEALPGKLDETVLFESLRYLAGRPLETPEAMTVSWRLAGNLKRLRGGTPVVPWASQVANEWVPMQILKISLGKTGTVTQRIGYLVDLRILAGSACPLRVTAFWSRELAGMLSRRIGFSGAYGKYRYTGPADLTNLRLIGLLEPERCKQHRPGFHEMKVPPSFVDYNRKNVLRMRCRVDPCPRDYTHPCSRCSVGYTECAAATHRLTYISKTCQICTNAEAMFDDDVSREMCIECAQKAVLRK